MENGILAEDLQPVKKEKSEKITTIKSEVKNEPGEVKVESIKSEPKEEKLPVVDPLLDTFYTEVNFCKNKKSK